MRAVVAERTPEPNAHFGENAELVVTQGLVLDLADQRGLPTDTTDRGVPASIEASEREAGERLQSAREDREYQERLVKGRHYFATRHGAMRSTLTHRSVQGDSTAGLPAIDESLSANVAPSSQLSSTSSRDAKESPMSTDYLDHEKLSRLIPGYVKPDENKTKD